MNMSDVAFELHPIEKKPTKNYRNRSKYDPILNKFLEGDAPLVEVNVQGIDSTYLIMQLKKRIDRRHLKDQIKASEIRNTVFLEKLK